MAVQLGARDEQDELAAEAVAASLECGNPMAVAALRPGERVLDLDSGGGIDVLLSARRVGENGFAYGVDMTDEMLELAQTNAAKAGASNVEFLKGTIHARGGAGHARRDRPRDQARGRQRLTFLGRSDVRGEY